MSLFQRRHYEWLAAFAGKTLDEQQCGLLASELNRDNPRFKPLRFIAACDRARSASRAAFLSRMETTNALPSP